MALQLTPDEARLLDGLKLKGVKSRDIEFYFKLHHIYQVHKEHPECNKGKLRDASGMTELMVNTYWKRFVAPKPIYIIKNWDSVMCEE